MHQRLDIRSASPLQATALYSVTLMLNQTRFGKRLKHLIDLKVSYLNECAFCIDKHTQEGLEDGLDPALMTLTAGDDWRESHLLTEAEKVALAWADGLTCNIGDPETDILLARLRRHYSEGEIGSLTMMVAVMNAWNRVGRACYSHAPQEIAAGEQGKELA